METGEGTFQQCKASQRESAWPHSIKWKKARSVGIRRRMEAGEGIRGHIKKPCKSLRYLDLKLYSDMVKSTGFGFFKIILTAMCRMDYKGPRKESERPIRLLLSREEMCLDLRGMGTRRVDELKMKPIELGNRLDECAVKTERNGAPWSLVSAPGKQKFIHCVEEGRWMSNEE